MAGFVVHFNEVLPFFVQRYQSVQPMLIQDHEGILIVVLHHKLSASKLHSISVSFSFVQIFPLSPQIVMLLPSQPQPVGASARHCIQQVVFVSLFFSQTYLHRLSSSHLTSKFHHVGVALLQLNFQSSNVHRVQLLQVTTVYQFHPPSQPLPLPQLIKSAIFAQFSPFTSQTLETRIELSSLFVQINLRVGVPSGVVKVIVLSSHQTNSKEGLSLNKNLILFFNQSKIIEFPSVSVVKVIVFSLPSKTIQVVFWLVPDFKINLVRFSTQ